MRSQIRLAFLLFNPGNNLFLQKGLIPCTFMLRLFHGMDARGKREQEGQLKWGRHGE